MGAGARARAGAQAHFPGIAALLQSGQAGNGLPPLPGQPQQAPEMPGQEQRVAQAEARRALEQAVSPDGVKLLPMIRGIQANSTQGGWFPWTALQLPDVVAATGVPAAHIPALVQALVAAGRLQTDRQLGGAEDGMARLPTQLEREAPTPPGQAAAPPGIWGADVEDPPNPPKGGWYFCPSLTALARPG